MIVFQFYCFVVVLLFAFALSSSLSLMQKMHVRITNNLNNKSFDYHCKSRDDDLGNRTLQPKGQWEFTFGLDQLHPTFFYCYFAYEHFAATFDVFSKFLKQECGGNNFFWTVQEDGFYIYHSKFGQNLKLHYWNS